MEIITDINTNINAGPISAGVGFFDGVHRGHMAIIDRTKGELPRAIISFVNQPAAFISENKLAHRLMSSEEKADILEKEGIDYLFLFTFDEKMRNTSAEEFFEKAIVGNNIKKLICGFNFRFGKGGEGDVELLRSLCEKEGITLEIVEAVKCGDEVISSSLIKKYLYKGDAKRAAELLGRNFYIKGTVSKGKQLGRTLGFPTANIFVDDEIIVPKWGVYQTFTTVKGVRYPSVTNIGNNPTVGDSLRLESHIIDFSGDIYGEEATVEFVDFIRPEMRFSGIEELKAQVHRDIDEVRKRNM
ncbi:MAG: bifunctional riboflavin kinase/FAD synthetase [Anaerofustis stercorihominis]|nr:bifunctional riboflavin kinase/FAD synthetase [Anaerofustis stercorihominis]